MSGMPEIKSDTHPQFRRIFVAGVFGGVMAAGLEVILFSESKDIEKVLQTQPLSPHRMEIRRTAEAILILDPMQMKSTHKWLGEKISEYEKLFSNIPSPEEVESRIKRKP
ncbi:MAG: hypothetical protein WAL88_00415 [Nitrosotalea sp.]